MTPIRIGALISGGGSNLQAIIDACEDSRIDGRMAFVGSDVPGAGGLQRARHHGIPTFVVDYGAIVDQYRQAPETLAPPSDFDPAEIGAKQHLLGPEAAPSRVHAFLTTRAVAEARLLDHIAPFAPDLLVLAGFMRNLTPYFIDRFNTDPDRPRIMNIHPALLPAFPGVDGYGDTLRYGCKVGGCTVHFIDYGEDSGPIIGQRCFPITESDTLDSVKQRGLTLEWQLYPECIQYFAQDRLQVVTMTHTGPQGRPPVQRRVVKILRSP
ncbi:phosphoribosylglycinamide formyltransferase [Desulfatitalea alkaliphila]|uniref:Phosphoribosylglycinamide formyltransferase n=1 Tax=Desulfatitalea alkaliphila TaxID=2929485 RepID=A0AA41R472_9BACT|nr:phosphoribosylglycinamide formyltransferase [Desulfatitalea alkaliphila]MCJ8500471.1 phosphoribosylglycinamide formyltransferase [Desulfatitalea alkaliphila]